MIESKKSIKERLGVMIKTRSFIAGLLLAVGLMVLSSIYSVPGGGLPDIQVLALILFMAGMYSGYYLGLAILEGGESTYFLVGLTSPISATAFLLTLTSQTLVATLLPLGLAFSVFFVNSGSMTDKKSYVRFVGSISKYLSQFFVLTFVLFQFVSPILSSTINFSLGVEISGLAALVLTAAEKIIRSREAQPVRYN